MIKDISFEITQKCLNNCLHCSSCSNRLCKQQIDFETICKTVDDMPKLGVERVCLSGGEPFLHKDLGAIVSYISQLGMDINIYSSGVIEHENKITCIPLAEFEMLKKLGLSKVMFNVQSSVEATYDKITGTRGHFYILKQSIRNAVSAGIYTEIHFVPMKLNIDDIDNVISLSENMGINKVSFLKLVPHGRAKENQSILQLSSDETLRLKQKLNDINSENIRIGIPLSVRFESDFCHAASSKLYIKFDGTVYGCEAFKYIQQLDNNNNNIQPCNIHEQSLLEIYEQSEYICATRNFVKKYSSINSRCESCPVQKYLELQGGNNNGIHYK